MKYKYDVGKQKTSADEVNNRTQTQVGSKLVS